MSQYAQISDLFAKAMSPTARGSLTDAQLTACLVGASGEMDVYFNGRYALPLIQWDDVTTEKCCLIAYYRAMKLRGYNPEAGGDKSIKDDYDDAIKWCRQVQMQQAHPNVTPQPSQTPKYTQPSVNSSSVVNLATGDTAPNRGW